MARKGSLLVNLGSPDSPSVPDVKRYLREFLMDARVLDTPWPLRALLVNGVILRSRPAESAEAYESIWTEEGSPLIVISRRVHELVREKTDHPVALGMRYGNPSVESAIRGLMSECGDELEEIFMVPLYPHYAMSSYETVVELARGVVRRIAPKVRLVVKPPFYDRPDYIDALVESARPSLERPHDLLLFSYHGIPERHVRKSDPTASHCLASESCCATDSPAHRFCYRHQVKRTTELFLEKAGIAKEKHALSFQSRLGRDPWLKPYTDLELERFARDGVKRILVICPAFVSDCLETLEEIAIRGSRDFVAAGGEELRFIPCMNDHPKWIDTLAQWCDSGEGVEAAEAVTH